MVTGDGLDRGNDSPPSPGRDHTNLIANSTNVHIHKNANVTSSDHRILVTGANGYIGTHVVGFTLSNICPPWVFGPYRGLPDLGRLCESMGLLWKLFDAEVVPPTDLAACTDVRDVAEALMRAIETPEAGGERFIVGGHFDWQTAADVIQEEFPQVKSRIPEGRPGYGKTEKVYVIDSSKAERVLGPKYTPLNVTLKDAVRQLLDVEKTSEYVLAR